MSRPPQETSAAPPISVPIRPASPPPICPNCERATSGSYCSSCGQSRSSKLVSLRVMIADFLDDELSLNARLPRSLALLLLHPGKLTEEYLRGRIVRYIPPLRLYIGASVTFFLLLALVDSPLLGGSADAADPTPAPALPAESGPSRPAADAPAVPASTPRGAVTSDDGMDLDGLFDGAEGENWAREIQVNTGVASIDGPLRARLETLGDRPFKEVMKDTFAEFREQFPTMVFLMLPFFALLLKILYVRRNRFYVEHFVFALHVHAFVFALFSVMLIVPDLPLVEVVIFFWMMIYIFLAMRRVYGQSMLRTGLKYLVLGWSYAFVFSIASLISMAVAFLLI